MISWKDVYHVLSGIVPLYVAMILGYACVKRWRIFTPEQCAGINRFVAVVSIPFFSFNFVISHDPYAINFKFVLSDIIQKVFVLVSLLLWEFFSKHGTLEWVITLFLLSSLPNTLIMGVPLLKAMYGDLSSGLMVQIVLLQGVVWFTVVLVLLEYRAAKVLIANQLKPDAIKSIASFRVEKDIISLNDHESLCAETENLNDESIHVVVRSMIGSRSRKSVFAGLDYYSTETHEDPSLRSSEADQQEASFIMLGKGGSSSSCGTSSSKPRSPDFPDVLEKSKVVERRGSRSIGGAFSCSVNAEIEPELHNGPTLTSSSTSLQRKNMDLEVAREGGVGGDGKEHMPPTNVMTWPIVVMVWRKMIKNPNIWASVLGLAWSLISHKCHIKFPPMISQSIATLSNTCLGLAMFSLGLFMALRPKLITCGKFLALLAIVTRFLIGPIVACAVSAAIGLRGDLLRISIVQAALPPAIVSFVYAKEYDSHPDIISTAVTFGIILAFPITIVYFALLGL